MHAEQPPHPQQPNRPAHPFTRRNFVTGSLVTAAALAAGRAPAFASTPSAKGNAVRSAPVRTDSGLVTGVAGALPSVTVYKGIPFAASTAGDNRWRSPRAPRPWTGVRAADTFGDICPQAGPASGLPPMSEDCLNLNVWTTGAGSGQRRPVLVWIYGGGFTGGYGAAPGFDGSGLAARGLVVVTFNYRTGTFGFLSTPELSRESGHGSSGNYGLLDQIAALRWVRRNIAAFGGDPDRVTVAGQSAGAGSVAFLLYSPLARGLFHAAVAESGVRNPRDPEIACLPTSYRTRSYAEDSGAEYAARWKASSLAQLRTVSTADLVAANSATDPAVTAPMYDFWGAPLWRPVVDGWVVPAGIDETLTRGRINDVPVLTGNNKDENGAAANTTETLDAYRASAARQYGSLAGEFLSRYPATTDAEAVAAFKASARDSARTSTWLWAAQWLRRARNPVYTYYWTHALPGQSASHGSEIHYVFDNLYTADLAWTDEDRSIADTLSSYVVNFAARGNPNGHGLPAWAPTRTDRATTMQLGDGYGPFPVAAPGNAGFFQRYYRTQPAW
ncbi:carboxylesterase/lipase family protein [Streptomyces sp. NPDC090306]|uniref:carboxylesterase/lipase family protein n=1 Tax=unclassified Streptomyces TaxID=2593676 RepID=UPI0036E76062